MFYEHLINYFFTLSREIMSEKFRVHEYKCSKRKKKKRKKRKTAGGLIFLFVPLISEKKFKPQIRRIQYLGVNIEFPVTWPIILP